MTVTHAGYTMAYASQNVHYIDDFRRLCSTVKWSAKALLAVHGTCYIVVQRCPPQLRALLAGPSAFERGDRRAPLPPNRQCSPHLNHLRLHIHTHAELPSGAVCEKLGTASMSAVHATTESQHSELAIFRLRYVTCHGHFSF